MINLQQAREQASNREFGANPDVIARGPAAPSGLWKIVLGGTADAGDFYQAWLALQCGMVGGVTAGLLLLRNASKPDAPPYVPAAAWPDAQRDLNKLAQVAQQAATERRSVVARSGPGLQLRASQTASWWRNQSGRAPSCRSLSSWLRSIRDRTSMPKRSHSSSRGARAGSKCCWRDRVPKRARGA